MINSVKLVLIIPNIVVMNVLMTIIYLTNNVFDNVPIIILKIISVQKYVVNAIRIVSKINIYNLYYSYIYIFKGFYFKILLNLLL